MRVVRAIGLHRRLNEGFATWVGWLAVDHIFPEWKVWEQFVSNEQKRGG
jgi:aminopeptidase N